ncbi:MAG: hypothetical protein ROR55_19805 [Devosia sp.]
MPQSSDARKCSEDLIEDIQFAIHALLRGHTVKGETVYSIVRDENPTLSEATIRDAVQAFFNERLATFPPVPGYA